MPKDDFRAVVSGMLYTHTIDGTGWPDAVSVCNNAAFPDEYKERNYYPVDVKALLVVADDMSRLARSAGYPYVAKDHLSKYAGRIRKALGDGE